MGFENMFDYNLYNFVYVNKCLRRTQDLSTYVMYTLVKSFLYLKHDFDHNDTQIINNKKRCNNYTENFLVKMSIYICKNYLACKIISQTPFIFSHSPFSSERVYFYRYFRVTSIMFI